MIEPILVYKDRNETIPYSKIVVPSSMRSPLWKYFGFPADKNNEIITKKKIVCCICHSYIAYNKNTTNLSTHLNCRHPEYLNNSRKKRIKIDQIDESLISSKRSKVSEIPNSDPEWCIEDDDSHSQTKDALHPTRIVGKCHVENKSQHMSNMIEVFISEEAKTSPKSPEDQSAQMIDDDYELIISADEQDNNQLIETLNYSNKDYSEDTESNSVEDLTQKNDDFMAQEFLTDMHDISEPTLYDSKSSQQSVSTGKIEMGNKDRDSREADKQEIDVMQQFKIFLIKDLVSSSIVDGDGFKSLIKTLSPNINIPNAAQVQKSLQNDYNLLRTTSQSKLKEVLSQHKFSILFNRLGSSRFQEISICYANEIENQFYGLERQTICICSDSLNFPKTIANQISNCSAFVIDFELNPSSERMISRLANKNDIPIIESFSSVISLALSKCFEHESVIEVIELIEGLMKPNTQSCLAKLEYLSKLTDGIQDSPERVLLYPHLMPVIQVLLSCVQPLKNCLDQLAFETTTFASIMKPIAVQLLNQHYRINEETTDTELETQLKQIIAEVLQQKIISNQFLTIASFVDPRFQGLICSDDLKIVRNELEKSIEATQDSSDAKKEPPNQRKSKAERNSGLLSLFANHSTIAKPKMPKNRFESEFRDYNEDVGLELTSCPMTWWLQPGSLYPNIKRQVAKYFCVPAFVNDAHCMPLSSQMKLLAKYNDLDENINTELVWLHLNYLRKNTLNVETNEYQRC